MKIKHFVGVMLALVVCSAALAGDEQAVTYKLFRGAIATDTLENASQWFPIKGANRIMIRTWSTKRNAFSAGSDADSLWSDSLAVFNVLLSDSVSFMGRDSLGTLVTARSTQTNTGAFPVCADSVMIVGNSAGALDGIVDTTYKMVLLANPPIRVQLRPGASGSGVFTYIVPTAPASVGTFGDGSFGAQYMRIRYQSLVRNTPHGVNNGPNRVGAKRVRMEALVIYKNR